MNKSKKMLIEDVSWLDRMRLSALQIDYKIDYIFSESCDNKGDQPRDIYINMDDYGRAKLIMTKDI